MMKESKYNLYIGSGNEKHILYNTRTGMMIRVPNAAYHALKNVQSKENPEKERYISSFVRRGFCVPADLDESDHFYRHYLKFLHSESEELSFTIAITTACNYRCFYCFEEGAVSHVMKKDTIDDICSFIEKNAAANPNCRVITIKWFGGEPLLDISSISEIGTRIKAFCQQQHLTFRTRIITNGSLLTPEVLDILCNFDLVSVQISLDGTCEEYCRCKGTTPDAYKAVLDIIRTQCCRVHFNLRFNCLPDNFQSLIKLTDELYSDKNIRENISLYLAPVEHDTYPAFLPEEFTAAQLTFLQHLYDLGWYKQIQHVMPSLRTSPCYNLQSGSYTIDPEGNLFACEAHLGDPKKRIAHIKDEICDIMTKKQTLRCSFNDSINSQCLNCSYFPLCFSGCPRQRRTDQSCRAFQQQTLETLKIIARIPG